jgi:hypothetical protein
MSYIGIQEARAWAEKTKLDLGTSLDDELEASIAAQVVGQIAQVYETSSWVSPSTTPKLVRSVVAMLYVSWIYSRTYAEDVGPGVTTYGELLRQRAEDLLASIISGAVVLTDGDPNEDTGSPTFYPTDVSTATEPSYDDTSLGAEKFTMGVIW